MKLLYFDCFAGASGDMILGASVAAGVDPRQLKEQLGGLGVAGYEISFETVDRSGISSTYARVKTEEAHSHRHLKQIRKIISDSRLSAGVKELSDRIFTRLAAAEARVHNQPIESVHFHEVGSLDAIIDVVGAAICFEILGVEKFASSPLHVGSGTVRMEHGTFPVPPPAVVELLNGIPSYATEIRGELVTPTGAAIITTVCEDFGPMPLLKLVSSGYGAGTRTYEGFPNALRILIGEVDSPYAEIEQLWILETNIDDMPAQHLGHVMDRAFELGALDCYFTSVQMKKNRPGVLLSVLCRAHEKEVLSRMMFTETTTLGIRMYQVSRHALERSVVRVETAYGPIDVKVAHLNGNVVNEMPEFEQCRSAARRAKVPLKTVEAAVRAAMSSQS